MLKTLNNLSMNAKVSLLGAVFAIGFVVFGLVTYSTIATTKIGSPLYQTITDSKALKADILPPPGYIVETYLLCHLSEDAVNSDKPEENLAKQLDRYKVLRSDYENFVKTWSARLPEGELKTDLLESSRRPAEAFFTCMDEELIPAFKSRDMDKASELLETKLPALYEKHFVAMMDVVEHTNKLEADCQAAADQAVFRSSVALLLIGTALLACVVGFTVWLRSGIAKQENINLDYAGQIQAIKRSQAVIEFTTDGHIVNFNENFSKRLATH